MFYLDLALRTESGSSICISTTALRSVKPSLSATFRRLRLFRWTQPTTQTNATTVPSTTPTVSPVYSVLAGGASDVFGDVTSCVEADSSVMGSPDARATASLSMASICCGLMMARICRSTVTVKPVRLRCAPSTSTAVLGSPSPDATAAPSAESIARVNADAGISLTRVSVISVPHTASCVASHGLNSKAQRLQSVHTRSELLSGPQSLVAKLTPGTHALHGRHVVSWAPSHALYSNWVPMHTVQFAHTASCVALHCRVRNCSPTSHGVHGWQDVASDGRNAPASQGVVDIVRGVVHAHMRSIVLMCMFAAESLGVF